MNMKNIYATMDPSTLEYMQTEDFAKKRKAIYKHIQNDPELRKKMRQASIHYWMFNSAPAICIRYTMIALAGLGVLTGVAIVLDLVF